MRSFKEFIIISLVLATASICQPIEPRENVKDSVKFYVYTRLNSEIPQALAVDVESVVRNILNPVKPITLAIHNMKGNQNASEYSIIKDTKLNLEDGNVIIVDYSAAIDSDDFEAAFQFAPQIAEPIADLIILLAQYFNADLQHFHLVGFSLGGQIAGLVGQQVYEQYGAKIKRITALDPAGLAFNDSTPTNQRLSPDDAEFVEVVHTNGDQLGFLDPCGHVDYYPNGGRLQAGCSNEDIQCSHDRAYQLVPEMWLPVKNQEFLVLKCSDVDYIGLDNCRWLNAQMGDLQHQLEGGVYYVQTNDASPFGKGAFKAQFL